MISNAYLWLYLHPYDFVTFEANTIFLSLQSAECSSRQLSETLLTILLFRILNHRRCSALVWRQIHHHVWIGVWHHHVVVVHHVVVIHHGVVIHHVIVTHHGVVLHHTVSHFKRKCFHFTHTNLSVSPKTHGKMNLHNRQH